MPFNKNQPAYIDFRSYISEGIGGLVAWVGSGLSATAGLPTWAELKKQLLDVLKSKLSTMELCEKEVTRRVAVIQQQRNYWISFTQLENELGSTTYRDTIRKVFSMSGSVKIPESYKNLWRLKIRGLLNLNLDRLASRAFSEIVNSGQEDCGQRPYNEFDGMSAKKLAYVLKIPAQFIANLHGVAEDCTSWVLTHENLKKLTNDDGYKAFIHGCAIANTILFVGVSADDQAAGGYLERLTNLGVDSGTHYWVTDRSDFETDRWAEDNGIRIIRYKSFGTDHSELDEFFQDLLSYVPVDEIVRKPVVFDRSKPYDPNDLPPLHDILTLNSDGIRDLLNLHAKFLLADNTEESYLEYNKFCNDYDEAIYRAWYTSLAKGHNHLFDYMLLEELGRGAFGKVYKACKDNGDVVAIKVLLEDIRRNSDLLSSFRRGVRSMQILRDHNVPGMVLYENASEIPAFVAMEFVNGPDLKEAIEIKIISDWDDIVKVALDLTRIIRSAHRLPERVLHRDIRPTNVMLKDYYANNGEINVVVLDFDLSWHRDACERSVIHGSSGLGYLAPEQLQAISGVTSRHTAVDVFGLGMTFYFMISLKDPIQENHKHATWITDVKKVASQKKSSNWKSVPNRFARLIVSSTLYLQSNRCDIAQIEMELARLSEVMSNSCECKSSELVAEEIVARSSHGEHYSWNPSKLSASIDLSSGISIEIIPDEVKQEMVMQIKWHRGEFHQRKNIIKWITRAKEKVLSVARSARWRCILSEHTADIIDIRFSVNVSSVINDIEKQSTMLDEVVKCLTFS